MVHKIFLGLGANVGDKRSNIKKAIQFLGEEVYNIIVAPIYETEPWGYKRQDNFLNTALKGETPLSASQRLILLKKLRKRLEGKKDFATVLEK